MRKLFACCLALAYTSFAQTHRAGPQVATFFSAIDDSDQPYGLYVPKNFDPQKKYPLVISLHGAWSNHRLNLRRVFGQGNRPGETDAEATRHFPPLKDVDFFVASPLARGTLGYQGIPEQDVYDVLADVRSRFPIDEDRVYLTGLSMGGGGTLWLGLTRPDLWAAIAPVCPAVPPGTTDFAPNALNLPVHLFQGGADPVVNPEGTRAWNERLRELGTKAEYTEYPNVQHNSWDKAYAGGAIFDWFGQFRRNRFPDRVRFVTDRYKYPGAYWVNIDRLTPGLVARIDARFDGPNRVVVTTENLDAFSLALRGHPKYNFRNRLIVAVDGKTLRLAAGQPAVFRRSANGWLYGKYSPAAGEKRMGLEGPIADAVASRHIYVYGTGGYPDAEELKARQEVASKAAEWSTRQLRLLLTFEVKADKDVRESDFKNANLVLFGTVETNSLIQRFADRLPLRLNAGAADYGLVYVYPIGDHYVLVNSGLPWWTGADFTNRERLRFLPPATILNSFGDFVLFKGGLDNTVAEGRFDRGWRLPADQAAKMKATQAVEVMAR